MRLPNIKPAPSKPRFGIRGEHDEMCAPSAHPKTLRQVHGQLLKLGENSYDSGACELAQERGLRNRDCHPSGPSLQGLPDPVHLEALTHPPTGALGLPWQ